MVTGEWLGCWVLGAGCWVLGAGCWVLAKERNVEPNCIRLEKDLPGSAGRLAGKEDLAESGKERLRFEWFVC